MKNVLKFLSVLTVFALIAVGCSKEPNGSIDKNNGEKGFVQLTISSDILPAFRGSEGDQEGASAEELKIDGSKGLKVYVFNEDGTLDYASPGVLTLTEQGTPNVFKSASFEVTAGNKFFFVFANDPASGGKIAAPTTGMTMENFMKQAVATTGAGGTLDIAVDNSFLLGTLWKSVTIAPGGGTSTAPNTVSLKIGRLSSKVMLKEITYTSTNTALKGVFSAGEYRIGTLPRNINTVGVHVGTALPTTTGVMVYSYVHNAPYLEGTPAGFNATDYIQYSAFKSVDGTNSFYTTENTAARDGVTGQQYFGNTTYIQIQTVYTPHASEVFDPATLGAGTLSGATFWTALIVPNPTTSEGQAIGGGKRIIISDPGSVTHHTDLNPASFLKYTNGLNYHKFAIFDGRETDDLMKFRVLRNHYYEFNVTKFNDLGSNIPDVDPIEPVPTKTTVDIEVTVTNWDKISSDVEV